MSRKTIKVDILNSGMLFGYKTPIYGITIEESLFNTFRDLGFNIRRSIENPAVEKELLKNIDQIEIDEEVKEEQAEVVHVVDNVLELSDAVTPGDPDYDVFANITEDQRKSEINKVLDKSKVKKWMTKEFYSEHTLGKMKKDELICILNCRGHFCSRKGSRDPYAPKFLDNKEDLIKKVLDTNAKV